MDKFTKRDATGSVDVEASSAAYADALTAWAAENETSAEAVEAAVEAVFDRFPGSMHVPVLVSFAVAELGATPAQHTAMTKRVSAYLKGQSALGRLEVTKGVGGGIKRLAKPGE
jgi:hypothetical protein